MITVERHVHADPEALWDQVGDLARWAELLPTVDRVEPLQDGPPRVGARYALRQPGLPRLVYAVTAWEPGRHFTWVASAPGVRTVGTHDVAGSAAGSLLRLGLRWTGPLRPLVERVYGRRTQGFVEQEAAAFARLAEEA